MIIAAQHGHEAVVQVLIEAGANVIKALDYGATTLYAAAGNGHETVVRALIELGADVNKAMDDGWTPLYIADREGHETIVQILKDAGAVCRRKRRRVLLPNRVDVNCARVVYAK